MMKLALNVLGLLATLPTLAMAEGPQPIDTVARYRYGMAHDTYIPGVNAVTLIPFDVIRFQEGSDVALAPGGMFTINAPGLYYIHMGLDWKAQAQTDRNLRMYGLRRKLAADTTPPNLKDERLASFDHPGSDAPRVSRYDGPWSPGLVPFGGFATTEVTMTSGETAAIGDIVQASLTSATDAQIGAAANISLQIQARVIAPNRVRVSLYNPSIPDGILIPPGTLRVLAQSSTLTMGESADAWNVLSTPLVRLEAGDRIYVAAKNSGLRNDFIQASLNSTFVQFERFAATSR